MVINQIPFFYLFDGVPLLKEKLIVSARGHKVNFLNYEGVVLISSKKREGQIKNWFEDIEP